MHAGALTTLEFDRIIEAVETHALTPLGAEALSQLRPLTDPDAVRTALAQTSETVRFMAANGPVPLEAPDDLNKILASLAIEAQPLEPNQLLALVTFLGSVERVSLKVTAASGGPYPALSTIVNGRATWESEAADVGKKIDASGEVSDDASPQLKAIRSRLRKQRNRLRGNLEAYLRTRDTSRYLQEQVISERHGRFVLVVRAEHRTAIPGIVHGSSSSGASLFLEPLSTVDINNEIVALEEQDRDETRRVLLTLSTGFRRRAGDLRRTLAMATEIDVLQAKAGFSGTVGGIEPTISDKQSLEIREARHPLLMRSVTGRLGTPPKDGKPTEPVPVDILVGQPTRALIVSGPNTGGKTVALKTAGLLALMAQAGLHIPAAPGSSVTVFRSIFADIGDEQSITQNLSTFSGHIANIVEMDRRLSLPALILLDEVGVGTDPIEGGALGRAIVEHFQNRGVHVIATTHDEVLKAYGASTDGVTSAAFGFDANTFAPTYRLTYGSAGRSLALKISERLGLAAHIIKAATELRSEREAQLADHLAQVDEDREKLNALSGTLDRREAQLATRSDQLDKREADLSHRQQASGADLNQSLDAQLRAARKEIDGVVSALRVRAAGIKQEVAARAERRSPSLSTGAIGELRSAAHTEIDNVVGRFRPRTLPSETPKATRRPNITLGARVTIAALGVEGSLRAMDDTEAEVEVHGKRVRVPLVSLGTATAEHRAIQARSHVTIQVEPPAGRLDELNLVGCRVDEALSRAGKHLDQAILGELRSVRFVHGHGTGRLRRAITKFLAGHPLVARVSPGTPDDGGSGVTIAELKE